ncbi:MAG: hypothetical protein ABJG78_06955 [Cyclobacteriaceae bacterium]
MPVEKYVQEAANLEVCSLEDQAQLVAVGVSPETFTSLPVRTGALRYAQSVWAKERHTKEEAEQQWAEQVPQAVELKDRLEHTFRFAFRERPDLLNKVHEIEQGNGNADLVQDLSDLSVLGEANVELLVAIGLDMAVLSEAATLSQALSNLLALVNGEQTDGNVTRVIRGQAYTLLKRSVDEIRSAGKFVFWKDKQRLKGYRSDYFNR